MTEKELKDDNGDTMLVTEVEGHYLVRGSSLEWRQNLRKAPMRADDVFICGYPKTGHHWVWEMTKMLVSGNIEHVNARMIEFSFENFALTPEKLQEMTSPRVLTFHGHFHELPTQALEKKCKVIHLQRGVKDVAVSLFHMISDIKIFDYNGNWNGFVGAFLKGNVPFGSWFDHSLQWRQAIAENPDYPIHVMRYECIKKDPEREIKRLAGFLGVTISEQDLEDIVRLTGFQAMKTFKESIETVLCSPDVSKSQKCVMYRKGLVGDWRNWFTVAQSDAFDMKLEGSGFNKDFGA